MKKLWTKWLAALLAACLMISAPVALMEELPEAVTVEETEAAPEAGDVDAAEATPEADGTEAGPEAPVEETTFELDEGDYALEDAGELPAESEADALDAAMAASAADVPLDAAHFPDEHFRALLSGYDNDGNGALSGDEIDGIGNLEFSGQEYTSLAGIEYLTELYYLDFTDTGVTTLDLTQNTRIDFLSCTGNQLTSLKLPQNGHLYSLYCDNNRLSTLDVSHYPRLEQLTCENNALTRLDVTQNPKLTSLNCSGNPLTGLDLSQNSGLYDLNCRGTQLSALDVSANRDIHYLDTRDTGLASLDISNLPLAEIAMPANMLQDNDYTWYEYITFQLRFDNGTRLITGQVGGGMPIDAAHFPDQGFRDFLALKEDLNGDGLLSDKDLADEDITIYPQTYYWDGQDHQIAVKSLKGIEYFKALRSFSCEGQTLTDLDLSGNSGLESLVLHTVSVPKLDLSANTALKSVRIVSNCSIGDVTFNDGLKALTYQGASTLTSLDLSRLTQLEVLDLGGNGLTALDVSRNTKLLVLYVYHNKLTSLDVSQNTALKELDCAENQLTTLDVSHNTRLEGLWVSDNRLTTLDVSHNTALTDLGFDGNPISEISLKGLNRLCDLHTHGTGLTELALFDCPRLVRLVKDPDTYIEDFNTHWEYSTWDDDDEDEHDLTFDKTVKLVLENTTPDFPLTQNARHTISVGESLHITTATAAVDYTSNKPAIASVTRDGVVTGKAEGTAKITVKLASGRKLTLTLTVNDPTIPRKLSFANDSLTMDRAGQATVTLTPDIEPATAAGAAIEWATSNARLATVKNGVVTLLGKGSVTITARAAQNSRAKAKVKIKITDSSIPTGVELDLKGTVKQDYRSPLQLNATLLPAGKARGTVTWKSSNTSIATVSRNGLVTPLKTGKVTITATSQNNKSAKVKLNLVDPTLPTGVELDRTGKVTIDLKDTLTLRATLQPVGQAESPIEWKTSNDKVATVKNGVVTPVKAGSVTITAKATKNNKSAKVKVIIKDLYAPKAVTIDQGRSAILEVGKKLALTASVRGEDGYTPRKKLTWSSSKTSVATVNAQTGEITAVAPGTAKITVLTDNGKKASISIKVPRN